MQVGKIRKQYDWSVTGSFLPQEVPQEKYSVNNRAEARELLGDFKSFGDKKAHITQRLITTVERRVR